MAAERETSGLALHQAHPELHQQLQALRYRHRGAYDIEVSAGEGADGLRQAWTARRLDESYGVSIIHAKTAGDLDVAIDGDKAILAEARKTAAQ